MRHQKKKGIIDREKSSREALLRSLTGQLITHEKINTTEAKAKILKSRVEKLISQAKHNTLNQKRMLKKFIIKESQIKKLFFEIAPRFKNRAGGYLRINKLGKRKGDNAPLVQIEIVKENEKPAK